MADRVLVGLPETTDFVGSVRGRSRTGDNPLSRVVDVIGLHVDFWSSGARYMVKTLNPGILKVLHTAVDVPTLTAWRAARPDGLLIFRSVQDDLSGSVAKRCAVIYSQVAPILGLVDVIETPWNEVYQSTLELSFHAALDNQAVAIIESWGKSAAIGSFSVDQPQDLDAFTSQYVRQIAPSKRPVYFSLHEYDAPTLSSNGYCGRYRSLAVPPTWSIILTEFGIDGGVIGRPETGYRSFGGGSVYGPQIVDHARMLEADAVRAVIFACGTFRRQAGQPFWGDYDVAGDVDVAHALSQEIPTMPTVGQGFQKCIPLLGQPTTIEDYFHNGTPDQVTIATFENGYATYRPSTNETVAVHNDGRLWTDKGNQGDGTTMYPLAH